MSKLREAAERYPSDESKCVRHLHVEHRLEAAFLAGAKWALDEAEKVATWWEDCWFDDQDYVIPRDIRALREETNT